MVVWSLCAEHCFACGTVVIPVRPLHGFELFLMPRLVTSIVSVVFLLFFPLRAWADCLNDLFSIEFSHAVCDGLTGFNRNQAASEEACRQLCCEDSTCDVYQWCGTSCQTYEGAWNPGNWKRCYAGSAQHCKPGSANWNSAFRHANRTVLPSRVAAVTRKRGFSGFRGDHFSCQDASALNLSDSWFYTWTDRPSPSEHCETVEEMWGSEQAAEFVPTIGLGNAQRLMEREHWKPQWDRANVHHLLGYIKPNGVPGRDRIDPAIAAADWVSVQQAAVAFDPPLLLVSPAPSADDFEDGFGESGASPWLEAFLGNCSTAVDGCNISQIAYIGCHIHANDAASLDRKVNRIFQRYGKQLWVLEFAISRWQPVPTREEQDSFMSEALPLLETNPRVHRYAWSGYRNAGSAPMGPINVMPSDSNSIELTTTGLIYASAPTATTTSTFMISTAVTTTSTASTTSWATVSSFSTPACAAQDEFLDTLEFAVCQNLTGHNQHAVATEEECRQLCCRDQDTQLADNTVLNNIF